MDRDHLSNKSGRTKKNKGGKIVPALCNIAGMLLILAALAIVVLSMIPQHYGLDSFNMTSGSMSPTIPRGSILYVKRLTASEIAEIQPDEIIGYSTKEDGLVFHRVIEKHEGESQFITKGDFNENVDPLPVSYDEVIGRVVRHYPVLGDVMAIYTSTAGKINLFVFAICGLLLNVLAARLRR